ncbi:putative cell morphogenesis protein Sog2 [Talaromyces proteolyticus]|uniref:Cell morphogenesis protein Sog2 n=1 Tax=Talaromyces proteolyticus TaxID=1131652 RepID=A0AAD4KNY2_9EURO|nr:putative cell morphogenesis protein Sog2 [Talaromyces proteolyticus]KAH8697192.1 putative cell morphogenesis protein Sog2 [Talaromyces proteolyticus]
MIRLGDTAKATRSIRSETSMEDITITPGSSFSSTGSITSAPSSVGDDSEYLQQTAKATKETNIHNNRDSATRHLTPEETIELTQQAVENGIQDTKRSLAGSEAVSDVVRPKLTIDLGHSHIAQIPEGVVDIIKDEVERLSLSNNHLLHIPYRFSECAHLRYLNIRANNFREFPKGIYRLPLLEILDLSRNKISRIPDEVRKLTSLRVFSIMQNRLDDLPAGLADMNKLQILKVSGNFLKYPLRRILENKESEVSSLSMSTNEKEAIVTAELKRILKTRRQSATPEPESGSDVSETIVDTPKPVKRGINSRFPVIPSTGDGSSDLRSPSLSRPPPIPMKSHQRLASGQGLGFPRPGIAPFANGSNERNRSNSEGIIPQSARNKRMGLISRKTDLGTLNEMRPYRNSHLRGLSHGSLLRTNSTSGRNGSNSSSPGSPRGGRRRARDGASRRMSSLPENKEETMRAPIVKGAKGILFSLFQIHSHISTLINVIKGDDARRHSLEIVFYNASTHVEQLNEALESIMSIDPDDRDFARLSSDVKRECVTCLMAYTHVGSQLRQGTERIVAQGDSRYVRSLMLTVYGSLLELRNACISLGSSLVPRKKSLPMGGDTLSQSGVEKHDPSLDRIPTKVVTPRENTYSTRRLRSDTMIQHPPNGPSNPAFSSSTILSPGISTPNSATLSYGNRSRSNSRTTTLLNSTGLSSLATPRSGESFSPVPPPSVSRINPVTGLDEVLEEQIFERIFKQLTATYNAALHALPSARIQFTRCLEAAEETREPEEIRIIWNDLIRRCNACYETSEALGKRLLTMKLKEPGVGMRNQREFWQLCKVFMQSFVDLVTGMREVRNMQLLPPDIVTILRPVQKASREAGRLIEASPWSYLADMSSVPPTAVYGPPLQSQHHASSSASYLSHSGRHFSTSPQSSTLPATPLSAALGPAVQATIPSTPASTYSDRFFTGDVFQRADTLLSMQNQTPYLYRR